MKDDDSSLDAHRAADPDAGQDSAHDSGHRSGVEETYGKRWQLLRDVAVFQVKLLVDGLRDLLMSPASLVAVLVGILTDREQPDRQFRRLIGLGAQSERWINLFGQGKAGEEPSIDELFERLDDRIREQHARGGVTAQAREVVDRAIDGVQRELRRGAGEDDQPAAEPSPEATGERLRASAKGPAAPEAGDERGGGPPPPP